MAGMGFSGEKKKFNWGDAAIAFFGGPEAAQTLQKRRKYEAEERSNQEAASVAYRALIARNVPEDAARTIALDPDRRAAFLASEYETKNVAPGSNLAGRNVETGAWETQYKGAPRQTEINGRIVNEDGSVVYEDPYPKIIPGPDGAFFKQPRMGKDWGGGMTPGFNPEAQQPGGIPLQGNGLPPGYEFEDEGGAGPAAAPGRFPRRGLWGPR